MGKTKISTSIEIDSDGILHQMQVISKAATNTRIEIDKLQDMLREFTIKEDRNPEGFPAHN